MTKLLLVEDDRQLVLTINRWLERELYEIVSAEEGRKGLELIKSNEFELAILDWDVPGISGLEICRQYRASGGHKPILILTGKQAVDDRITGLDSGADDYLTKPFSLKELSARVRALLRRPAATLNAVLQVGDLSLDPAKYQVLKRGVEVQLMKRDFALLEFFMRHPDSVFSAEALLQRVWETDSEATGEALRTAIKRLRQKLDDNSEESNSIIENIPRVGYRLRARS
jgi:DNA-binding response OmpR family regulator